MGEPEQEKIPVYMGEPVTYTIPELEVKALDFLKVKYGKKYRNMDQKEMKETALLKAKAAKRYAENLIEQGTPDFVAWPMAIRSQILETESD
jgi:hypothetical protein